MMDFDFEPFTLTCGRCGKPALAPGAPPKPGDHAFRMTPEKARRMAERHPAAFEMMLDGTPFVCEAHLKMRFPKFHPNIPMEFKE